MLEENQNLPFRERQLKIIEEGRNIRQQIELLKNFLSLYGNGQLVEISQKLSVLKQKKEKTVEKI